MSLAFLLIILGLLKTVLKELRSKKRHEKELDEAIRGHTKVKGNDIEGLVNDLEDFRRMY